MANITSEYPKVTTWAEFSAKLVRFYNLPEGSGFALKRHSASARRIIVRSDIKIRRKPLVKADHPHRHDNLKAIDVIKRIKNMLPPHYKFSVIAIGPDGARVDGHTSLDVWRSRAPKPTPQQLQQEAETDWLRREEVGKLCKLALMMLADLSEGVEDPEQKIPQAVIQALLDQFGNTFVKAAVVDLRLSNC
jgi:hypothetical protein